MFVTYPVLARPPEHGVTAQARSWHLAPPVRYATLRILPRNEIVTSAPVCKQVSICSSPLHQVTDMAHITEIKIDGLLGREDSIRLELDSRVNIFFGENGCGKTTLLKVLDAALSRNGSVMEGLPVAKAVVDIYSSSEKRVFRHTWERREGKAIQLKKGEQYEQMYAEFFETEEGRAIIHRSLVDVGWRISPTSRTRISPNGSWAHTFLPTTRLYFGGDGQARENARQRLSEKELDNAFSESVSRSWLQFYSKTLAEVRSIQESGLLAVLRHVLDQGSSVSPRKSPDISAIFARVENFLARQSPSVKFSLGNLSNFRQRYEQEPNLRRIIDNLDEVERSIEKAMVPVNNFLDTIKRLFSRGKSLNSDFRVLVADGRALPISQLSSGEKHLIRILLSSMTAGANSVLIDEPELSLHIDWQRVFVQTIQSLNPECQLILASHSPEIMAEIPDRCIFKL